VIVTAIRRVAFASHVLMKVSHMTSVATRLLSAGILPAASAAPFVSGITSTSRSGALRFQTPFAVHATNVRKVFESDAVMRVQVDVS